MLFIQSYPLNPRSVWLQVLKQQLKLLFYCGKVYSGEKNTGRDATLVLPPHQSGRVASPNRTLVRPLRTPWVQSGRLVVNFSCESLIKIELGTKQFHILSADPRDPKLDFMNWWNLSSLAVIELSVQTIHTKPLRAKMSLNQGGFLITPVMDYIFFLLLSTLTSTLVQTKPNPWSSAGFQLFISAHPPQPGHAAIAVKLFLNPPHFYVLSPED